MNWYAGGLDALMHPLPGRSCRISSNEQPNWHDGNFDMTRLEPGETLRMPVLEGPGFIHHIWMTSHAGGVDELNSLTLRIWWDGRHRPAVEVPLGHFFAIGNRPAVVESIPVQVSPSGSLTCYWRMPFVRTARIEVTNDHPFRSTGLYWQVDWVQLEHLPADTPYFHAAYRCEFPAIMGRDYLIADIEGAGHYVGTVLEVTLAQDGWFGEGDDYFYIDGEEVPSLQGTGTEDYFNDAWGFRPRSSLWFGQPRWQGYLAGDEGICYRWHVLDPVRFRRSLRVAMEHKGNWAKPEKAWYIERPDYFSSVALWYQTGEAKPFGNVPSWPERCVPWVDVSAVEAFASIRAGAESRLEVVCEGMFGGRPMLLWSFAQANASLSLPFTIRTEGRTVLRLFAAAQREPAPLDVLVDDRPIASVTIPRATESPVADVRLGEVLLCAGEHTVTLRSSERTPRAAEILVERLRLLHLPPEVDRAVRTNNEVHFIRLGIGRAVYAFRLVHRRLPQSLEELVASGIMNARYLLDENLNPMASRLEDDALVVWSTAPSGWEARFRGLDARR